MWPLGVSQILAVDRDYERSLNSVQRAVERVATRLFGKHGRRLAPAASARSRRASGSWPPTPGSGGRRSCWRSSLSCDADRLRSRSKHVPHQEGDNGHPGSGEPHRPLAGNISHPRSLLPAVAAVTSPPSHLASDSKSLSPVIITIVSPRRPLAMDMDILPLSVLSETTQTKSWQSGIR